MYGRLQIVMKFYDRYYVFLDSIFPLLNFVCMPNVLNSVLDVESVHKMFGFAY